MNKFSVARYSHKGVHFCMSDLKLASTHRQIYVISTIPMLTSLLFMDQKFVCNQRLL